MLPLGLRLCLVPVTLPRLLPRLLYPCSAQRALCTLSPLSLPFVGLESCLTRLYPCFLWLTPSLLPLLHLWYLWSSVVISSSLRAARFFRCPCRLCGVSAPPRLAFVSRLVCPCFVWLDRLSLLSSICGDLESVVPLRFPSVLLLALFPALG